MAQGLQRGALKLRRQAEPLEPVDEVVGEQEQMEVRLVREEVASGDAAQGVVPFELLDEQLDAGAVVVEAPEIERLQRQVGDQDLVVVLAELEEASTARSVPRAGADGSRRSDRGGATGWAGSETRRPRRRGWGSRSAGAGACA